MARLRIDSNGKSEDMSITTPVVVMGRDDDNTVVLDDKQASRRHCQIEKFDGGYKIVDLESRNGTKVNGAFVNQHLLRNGDRIEVGAVVVTFLSTAKEETDPSLQAVPPPQHRSGPPVRSTSPVDATMPSLQRPSAPLPRVVRRSSSGGLTTSLVIVAVVLVGGFIAFKTVLSGENPIDAKNRQAWMDADKLQKDGKYDKAIDAFKTIDARSREYYDAAQERIAELEKVVAGVRLQKQAEAEEQRIREFRKFAEANVEKAAEVERRFELFKREFPTSRAIPDLEKWIKGLKPKNGGDPDGEGTPTAGQGASYASIETVAGQLQAGKKYGEALKTLKDFVENDPTSKDAERAAEKVKEILNEAELYFGEKNEQGKAAEKAGNLAEAKAAFEAVITSFGDEKSLFEFALQAKREVKRLDELAKDLPK